MAFPAGPYSWRVVMLGALLCLSLHMPAEAGQSEPAPVRVGGAVKPPARTKTVKPTYPAVARARRIQGVVILEVTVGSDGRVRDSRVIRSLPGLDEAATAAMKQWEFKPTLVGGKPVPVMMTIPMNFSLQ